MATVTSSFANRSKSGHRTWIATVALVAAAALAAAGCAGEDEPAPPRPIIQGGPATTAGGEAAPPALAPGPLEPGTYTMAKFRPRLSFRVGKGWGLLGDNENGIALAPKFDLATGPDKQLAFTAVKWVFDEPLLTDRQLATEQGRHIRSAPRDLVGWLRAHPYLEVGPSRPARLGAGQPL